MKIGIALGSGAARGFAHIGVLRELDALGVRPTVVCGSSMGALVAAAYAAGRLDAFERFALKLDQSSVLGLFDVSFRGGLIQARRLFEFLADDLPDRPIPELPMAFGVVATELGTGREVWLTEGSLHEALRASIALPGLIAPVRRGDRWLTDGGIVNPVPVSLCRALGAEAVVAVELEASRPIRFVDDQRAPGPPLGAGEPRSDDAPTVEGGLGVSSVELPDPVSPSTPSTPSPSLAPSEPPGDDAAEASGGGDLAQSLGRLAERVRKGLWGSTKTEGDAPEPPRREDPQPPSVYEVISQVVYLMQVRITRHRLAGEPPDLHVRPQLAGIGLLDFHRGDEAITEGRRAVRAALAAHRLMQEDASTLLERFPVGDRPDEDEAAASLREEPDDDDDPGDDIDGRREEE